MTWFAVEVGRPIQGPDGDEVTAAVDPETGLIRLAIDGPTGRRFVTLDSSNAYALYSALAIAISTAGGGLVPLTPPDGTDETRH